MRLVILTLLIFLCLVYSEGSGDRPLKTSGHDDIEILNMIDQMSLEDRLGQIFVIRAHSNLGADHIADVKKQIEDYKVGGLCFFQGDPVTQAKLTNDYQQLSDVPLLISMDAEWSLAMRFKEGVIQYPRPLMYGAIQDLNIIYDFGRQVAKELKRIGVHMNYGPVADINNNPNNPVINDRSFGENKNEVTARSYMYVKGMQDNGVMAVAKHFPGHGNTDVDSHKDLPVLTDSRIALENNELYPFRALVRVGVAGIMVAHLHVPSIDSSSEFIPMSLSKPAIDGILRDEYGYDGLVMTDAMEMKGVTKHYNPGEAAYQAFVAGNDFVLLPDNMSTVYDYFTQKLESGELTEERLNESVYRILLAKKEYGVLAQKPIKINNIAKDLNSKAAIRLKEKLISQAITLVRDESALIPIKDSRKLTVISIGGDSRAFQEQMKEFGVRNLYQYSDEMTKAEMSKLVNQFGNDDQLIVSVHASSRYASRKFGISSSTVELINSLEEKTNLSTVVFGNPYSLKNFDSEKTLVCAYENDPLIQSITAKALVGKVPFHGKLPVTVSDVTKQGDGVYTIDESTLEESTPVKVGMNENVIHRIDQLIDTIITSGAAPGCQVLVAKDGKIIMDKSYGHFGYDSMTMVKTNHLYDLASVTKVASTTLAIMKLVDDGFVELDSPIVNYIPELAGSNKANLSLRKMMSHHARLIPWIPFYKNTLIGEKNPVPDGKFYRHNKQPGFGLQVTDDLYLREDYRDTIFTSIINSDLREKSGYRYSDLGLILSGLLVEKVSGQPLDDFVRHYFYEPMGLTNIGYRPLDRYDESIIAPTEVDQYFRHDTIRGYVHDMACAMMNGVAGHAGLFSNARDLAIIFQMLLNGGHYDGKVFLSDEVIDQFLTRYKEGKRRGIGFDMKNLEAKNEESCNIAFETSDVTFGHYGFTGTAVWADPDNDLIYVFLSNRTFPTMDNRKLYEENFRSRIQSILYQSL